MYMATVLPTPAAWAVELYKLDGDGPWQLGAASVRLAETFTTGGLRMNLDNVSLRVRNANQNNNQSTAGTLEVWLFSTDGDQKPRDFLYTIATNQFFGTWADETPTYNVSYTLNPYTTYAVVFQGSSGSTISWKYRNDGSVSSQISPTPTFRDFASSNNGVSWGDGAPNVGYIMTVNASNLATQFTWTGGGSSGNWTTPGTGRAAHR